MIDSFEVVNNSWFWQIIISAFFLWLIFIWKEWKQHKASTFYLKVILAFLALSSLVLIILRPLVNSSLDNFELALLTKNYNDNQLDSLKASNKDLKTKSYNINEPILDNNKIPSSIYILGEGIAPFDFYQIDTLNVKYIGNVYSSGISKFNYKQEQIIGNSLAINGVYTKSKKGTKLILQDAAKNNLDSIIFKTDSTLAFKLSTSLKVKGDFEYYITEKDSIDNVLSSNPFGVKVNPESLLKILIINEFPTFETKYLKNYLAEKGHELIVRSQITRGKFKYEYFNIVNRPIIDFSEISLTHYDILIIDSQSFRNLSSSQKNNLERVIRNNGLGMFVQPNPSYNSSRTYLSNFSFQLDNSTILELDKWSKIKLSKHSYNFKSSFALNTIHQSNDKILTAYKSLGNGRVGTSVFENTFQLLLNGNKKIYQKLWVETINALGKKKIPSATWEPSSNIVFKNQPFNFKLRTLIDYPLIHIENDNDITLINDIDIKSLWKGRTYPKHLGWGSNKLKQDSTQIFKYYVSDTTHWKALQSHQNYEANKRAFNSEQSFTTKQYIAQKPMTLIWLYLIFLSCIGFIWLEPKL
jgi:hypothetical protein